MIKAALKLLAIVLGVPFLGGWAREGWSQTVAADTNLGFAIDAGLTALGAFAFIALITVAFHWLED